jgi:hypothetical protein
MWCKLLCLAGSDLLRDQNLVAAVMAELAAQDWEARTGVGSVREVHRQTVTGLVRVGNMPWIG